MSLFFLSFFLDLKENKKSDGKIIGDDVIRTCETLRGRFALLSLMTTGWLTFEIVPKPLLLLAKLFIPTKQPVKKDVSESDCLYSDGLF